MPGPQVLSRELHLIPRLEQRCVVKLWGVRAAGGLRGHLCWSVWSTSAAPALHRPLALGVTEKEYTQMLTVRKVRLCCDLYRRPWNNPGGDCAGPLIDRFFSINTVAPLHGFRIRGFN